MLQSVVQAKRSLLLCEASFHCCAWRLHCYAKRLRFASLSNRLRRCLVEINATTAVRNVALHSYQIASGDACKKFNSSNLNKCISISFINITPRTAAVRSVFASHSYKVASGDATSHQTHSTGFNLNKCIPISCIIITPRTAMVMQLVFDSCFLQLPLAFLEQIVYSS